MHLIICISVLSFAVGNMPTIYSLESKRSVCETNVYVHKTYVFRFCLGLPRTKNSLKLLRKIKLLLLTYDSFFVDALQMN